ncbi:MAG: type II toxin-antitoxin system mRNA interferase toxin, RelE/StbE family [Verrucomicrobia bacterium]|nr:type II toxin-antitoxin system mRNA interferase toxin, RelE/StbE family [Verrucomicrobiota bacterium]
MEIAFSTSFRRTFRKRIAVDQELEAKYWQQVRIFLQNPHDPRLRTHKLSGDLREIWSFSIGHDMRVVFFFAGDRKAVFTDVGKHDEVY